MTGRGCPDPGAVPLRRWLDTLYPRGVLEVWRGMVGASSAERDLYPSIIWRESCCGAYQYTNLERPGCGRQGCLSRAWGDERAAAVIEAAQTTLQLWGPDGGGLDFDALAADIAVEARLALTLTEEINQLDKRIAGLYDKADPAGIVRSAPGVGRVGAPQILGRLGDPTRFANLAAVRSFAGLVPGADSSGQADGRGGLTKAGDACLREAAYMAADHARKIDPTLAARYHRLMLDGKHHHSAVCTLAAILLTRIAACLRTDTHYVLRDTDGRVITEAQGRAIVADRYRPATAAPPGDRRRRWGRSCSNWAHQRTNPEGWLRVCATAAIERGQSWARSAEVCRDQGCRLPETSRIGCIRTGFIGFGWDLHPKRFGYWHFGLGRPGDLGDQTVVGRSNFLPALATATRVRIRSCRCARAR